MTVPRSTLRFQLHKGFTLDDAAAQVDYLASLGVSHAYASPITTATSGSTHGYDVVDYARVNPELGGEEALRRFVEKLREHEMGLIVDIVPNHMGVGGAENAWWQDILEWGRHAAHAHFFDVDWHSPDPALRGKVLAPFLGAAYGEELQAGKIKLAYRADEGRFVIEYYSNVFPVCPVDYPAVMQEAPELAQRFSGLTTQPADQPRAADARTALATIAQTEDGQAAIEAILAAHAPDTPTGRERLHRLLERQHYRLAWWRTAADEVNWRRFFDVSTLGGVRVERPEVFEASHALIFRLFTEGLIDGVRVDHVDGLAEPREYSQRLRARLEELPAQRPEALRHGNGRTYFVVEKILARGEPLRRDWQVDGTTGYDFMNDVGALLHDPDGAQPLAALWAELTGRSSSFAEEALIARRKILAENLAAELDRVTRALHRFARDAQTTRDFTFTSIRRVVTELVVHFPVYRIYPVGGVRSAEDERYFSQALDAARASLARADHVVLEQVAQWLGGKLPDEAPASQPERSERSERTECPRDRTADRNRDRNHAQAPAGQNPPPTSGSQRRAAQTLFSQLTSPVAAKAVEDTACYRYGRLISRNEVGADPGEFSLSVEQFHDGNQERFTAFPHAMLCTATHDHKRGEDVRARIAALSQIPDEWAATLKQWSTLNTPLRRGPEGGHGETITNGDWSPGPAAEAMLYQTLVGCWPLTLDPDDAAGVHELAERVAQWQLKALREAKLRTSWFAPDEAYENACKDFLFDIVAPQRREGFLRELSAFVGRIGPLGAMNSLQQTLLRLTSPGVPDLYQGTELWDFSLVDPDNRRPVDYDQRREWLADIEAKGPPSEQLANWRDGRVKLAIVRRALALRKHCESLFAQGDYIPLKVEGEQAKHVIAYARHAGSAYAVTIATRLAAPLLDATSDVPLVDPHKWGDTSIVLPEALHSRALFDWLSQNAPKAEGARLLIRDALAVMPVALLVEEGVPKA
ncbi:Malto-oligosyltrehalose synthase [Candidatus Burkholderia verschuerenii]|uniref:Malto-oligosyltrehalose synthase n=1 Tax=Candidatus Burkholderia verschuerenii TaxID=242163 RepID=A0A0L0MC52_9BURK|nr:malto-oligosyltrehalose synthase [Candidatus Burkholderia verschuerenii]KND59840.1 Malto-oligosyltrehalose synthase [Candidatus Burkholderia verschuerenii]